jgi:glycosyltransferase involved in cell wall biosynthesis
VKIGIYSFEHPSHIYIGGAGEYVKQLSEHLAKLGHSVDVFVASFEAGASAVVEGVTLRTIPIRNVRLVKSLQYQLLLKRAMWLAGKAVGGYDVLHSNCPFIVRGLGAPSVMTVHHVVASLQHDISKRALQGELNPVGRFRERRAVNRADRIVTVSAQSKADLISFYGVSDQQVVPILNGIPFEPYQFSDAELAETRARFAPARNGTLLVAAPGRLDDERKGLKYLLEALRQLLPSLDFRCVILGRGGLEAYREYLDDERLRNCLEFPGFVDLEVKRKLMAAADLFVLPSTLEGCPISLLEAMAAGRPVVASRVGGIPEVVRSSKQGILVPAKDPEALARAIQDLATDGLRRDEIGTYNRTFAKDELSWTRAAERTLEVYESAIENARQGDRASFA